MNVTFSKRRRLNFILLFTANVIAALVFLSSFKSFVSKINEDAVAGNIKNIEDSTATLVDSFGTYLMGQDMVINGYANYIMNSEMTQEEAEKYLFTWKDFYDAIAIVDIGTYQGRVVSPETPDGAVDYDFLGHGWAMKICNKYKVTPPGEVRISEVFSGFGKDKYEMAFYAPIEIEGVEKILIFVFDTDTLQSSGMNVKGIDPQYGLLIDSDGNVIIGEFAGVSKAVGRNYYNYIDSREGEIKSSTIREELEKDGQYTYYITDYNTNVNYACVAQGVPFTDDWTYIYNAPENLYGAGDTTDKMEKFILIFAAIWLGLVMLFFILYNIRLKDSFAIIEKQNVDLEYASKAKSAFVSNVSHELRTPINAVLGMNEMILKESGEDNIKEYAYDIRSAGKALLSVINDVLDFSKIESGKMEIFEAEYSLVSIVKDVYTLIQLKAESKYLDFIINVSENVPATLIGDSVRIRQILVNLLTNAVKYTDKGNVTLRIDCDKKSENECVLSVSVDDTGIGMRPEEMDKLYEEYSRLDMKKNYNTEGTGLGIPIVRKLLIMMGSEMKVESTYGVGSRFFFDLTQKVSDWTPVGGLNLLEKEDGREAGDNSEKVKEATGRILAVDDTSLNLKVLTALLKDTKLTIDVCDGGMRALKMCDSVKYDLIFLDHRMPNMDGIETIHRLKETSLMNKETPVIALTANVISGAREMYIAEGFEDFMSKPINIVALNECLEKYLT